MYNGIGLTTPRGSGTNGYVQRNLSSVTATPTHQKYKTEEEIKKAEAIAFRGPNPEILAHQRKRQIELQCVELEELMEEQGFGPDEIDEKVALYRKSLRRKHEEEEVKIASGEVTNPKALIFGTKLHEIEAESESGRPILKNSHEVAAVKMFKNAQFKEALGLDKSYVDGSSFQRAKIKQMKKTEEEMNQKAKEVLQNDFLILEDSSSSDSDSDKGKEKKKSKKTKESKESEKHKKSKKRKRSDDNDDDSDKSDTGHRKNSKKHKSLKERDIEIEIHEKVSPEKSRYSTLDKDSQRSSKQMARRDESYKETIDSHKGRRLRDENNELSNQFTSTREQETSRLIRPSAKSRNDKGRRSPSSSSPEDYDLRYKDHTFSSQDRENHMRRIRDQDRRSPSPSQKNVRRNDSLSSTNNRNGSSDHKRRNISPIRQVESRSERMREDDRNRHFSHKMKSPPPSSSRNSSSVIRRDSSSGHRHRENIHSPYSARRSRSMSPLAKKKKMRRSRSRSEDRRS